MLNRPKVYYQHPLVRQTNDISLPFCPIPFNESIKKQNKNHGLTYKGKNA